MSETINAPVHVAGADIEFELGTAAIVWDWDTVAAGEDPDDDYLQVARLTRVHVTIGGIEIDVTKLLTSDQRQAIGDALEVLHPPERTL